MPPEAVTAYFGLGSNLGDRQQNLDTALELLSRRLTIEKVSSIYDTEPVPDNAQPRFLNLVCRIRTSLPPRELLALAQETERQLGRRPGPANSPRPIDIDILLYNEKVVQERDLVIPHPRMTERAFVLVPLAEIAPDAIHPLTGKTAGELRLALKDVHDVRKWRADDVRDHG